MKFQSDLDETNQPLKNKSKNASRGWEGQAIGEDALEELIDKT